jgi:hypothetical protein
MFQHHWKEFKRKEREHVRFQVITAVIMKAAIFEDIKPGIPYMNRRFGRICQLLAAGLLLD